MKSKTTKLVNVKANALNSGADEQQAQTIAANLAAWQEEQRHRKASEAYHNFFAKFNPVIR